MENSNLTLIDTFLIKRKNKVEEHYNVFVSQDCFYIIQSNKNYGEFIKSIFSGIGEVVGLFGDAVGLIGGVASEITGSKFSQMLKDYSKKSSDKDLIKLINNLDTIAERKKGITKIDFNTLKYITVKKGYVINGNSTVAFHHGNEKLELEAKNKDAITKLTDAVKMQNLDVEIRTKYWSS